jgi:hypothetical protein
VSLNIGSSLTGGIGRVANRNGAIIVLAYLTVGSVWQVAFYSAFVTWLQQSDPSVSGVSLPVVQAPLSALVGACIALLLLLQYLTIVAIRTFVDGRSGKIPSEYYTRNVGIALVNSVLGSIAFGLVVTLGSLLLIPGIIAYVAFIFVVFYIVVKDENFIAAFRDSWTLTRGHWLSLCGLLLVTIIGVGFVSGFLSALASLVLGVIGKPTLGTLAVGVVSLPFSVVTLGILSEAFNQLQDGQAISQSDT